MQCIRVAGEHVDQLVDDLADSLLIPRLVTLPNKPSYVWLTAWNSPMGTHFSRSNAAAFLFSYILSTNCFAIEGSGQAFL
jgi:hypothetical protein